MRILSEPKHRFFDNPILSIFIHLLRINQSGVPLSTLPGPGSGGGLYMKYRNRFVIFLFSILMLVGVFAFAGATETSAQTRTVRQVIYRPIIVRRPFFYSRYYYDPFYDPYSYDPYLRAQRDKYYAEQRVARERRDMAEHRAKFYADGILTPKEQEQMASDREQLTKAMQSLR